MKFKTYQSCIGIFIVAILAVLLYVFLKNDTHKRIVLYSTFSLLIVWSGILMYIRHGKKKELRRKTKECILNDTDWVHCPSVKQKIAKYAQSIGKPYNIVLQMIRDQILSKSSGAGPKRDEYYYQENAESGDVVPYEEGPIDQAHDINASVQLPEQPSEYVDGSIDSITTKKINESNELTTFIDLMQKDVSEAYQYAADILHDTYLNDKVKSELCKRLEEVIGDSKHRDEYLKMISEYSLTFDKSFEEASEVMRNNIVESLINANTRIRGQLDRMADYDMNISDHDFIVKKMVECVLDTATNGRICKEVASMVNLYAKSQGKTYDEIAVELKQSAFSLIGSIPKKGGVQSKHSYGEFVPDSGYQEF